MRHLQQTKTTKGMTTIRSSTFNTPKSVLENHIEEGFMIKEIASMLSVSESTIYRRMQTKGLSS